MTTTFKLKVDGDNVVIDSVEDVAESFDDIVESAEQVNTELDDQKKKYSDLREEMQKVEKQSDRTFGKKGSGGSDQGIGILGKAAAGVIILKGMTESAKKVRESIASLAAAGNKDMQALDESLNRTTESFGRLVSAILSGGEGATDFTDDFNRGLDAISARIQGISLRELFTKEELDLRKSVLESVDKEMKLRTRINDIQKLSLTDAKNQAEEIRNQLSDENRIFLGKEKILELQKELLALSEKVRVNTRAELTDLEKGIKLRQQFREDQKRYFVNEERVRFDRIRAEADASNKRREEIRNENQARIDAYNKEKDALQKIRADQFTVDQERIRKLHQDKMSAIQAERDKLKETMGQPGGAAGQLLGQQSTEDVLKQIMEQRGGTRQDKRDVMKDFKRFMQGPGRGESPAEFAKFQEQFAAEAKQAVEKNAAETIISLRKGGKITEELTRALAKATKELIDQQAEQEKQARELRNVQTQLNMMASQGRNSRGRSGARN